MISHALAAYSRGFSVFPVEPGGKRPLRVIGGPIEWSKWATRELGKVVEYWKTWPDANVGISCKRSSLLVIDCDEKPGHTPGADTLDTLLKKLGLRPEDAWDTYTVRTGSGGLHLYYTWPPHVAASQRSIAPLVDIRSNGGTHGGYVLGAGSVTPRGAYQVEYDRQPAPCPREIVELCRERPHQVPRKTGIFQQPGSANYEGLLETVRYAGEGNRNHCLHWAACAMAKDGAPLEEAERLLSEASAVAGLPPRESIPTIRSAYRQMSR